MAFAQRVPRPRPRRKRPSVGLLLHRDPGSRVHLEHGGTPRQTCRSWMPTTTPFASRWSTPPTLSSVRCTRSRRRCQTQQQSWSSCASGFLPAWVAPLTRNQLSRMTLILWTLSLSRLTRRIAAHRQAFFLPRCAGPVFLRQHQRQAASRDWQLSRVHCQILCLHGCAGQVPFLLLQHQRQAELGSCLEFIAKFCACTGAQVRSFDSFEFLASTRGVWHGCPRRSGAAANFFGLHDEASLDKITQVEGRGLGLATGSGRGRGSGSRGPRWAHYCRP